MGLVQQLLTFVQQDGLTADGLAACCWLSDSPDLALHALNDLLWIVLNLHSPASFQSS